MTNVNHTTLYVGVTSDLYARISDHKKGRYPNSFTYRYHVTKLVYYESFHSIQEAIDREKQLKAGPRFKKEVLIHAMNPEWKDLFEDVKKW